MFDAAIWRNKTDDEVVRASVQLNDYTDEAQQAIRAEMQRRELVADQSIASDPEDDESPETSHYFGRLWTGHVPLRTTYWVWGVGGALVWVVLLSLAPNLLTLMLLGLLQLGYLVFVWVSIWRSAGRYRGNRAWAELARVFVALSITRVIVDVMSKTFGAE